MPIFDFKCNGCGKVFEKLVRKEEDKVCPDCASKDLEKQVSSAGFALKGTGWYATDFKSKK
jgi:putative FmdB family regulatory protein